MNFSFWFHIYLEWEGNGGGCLEWVYEMQKEQCDDMNNSRSSACLSQSLKQASKYPPGRVNMQVLCIAPCDFSLKSVYEKDTKFNLFE